MKKNIFAFITIALALAACSDDYDPQYLIPSTTANYLYIDQTDFSFGSREDTTSVYVESLSTPWKFENAPDWVKFSPSSGSATQYVDLMVGENLESSPRTALFAFASGLASWNYSRGMSVSQAGAQAYLELDRYDFEASAGGGSFRVNVKTNSEWDAAVTFSRDYNWLSVDFNQAEDYLTITVGEYIGATASNRNGYVSVNYDGGTVLITITQTPPSISTSLADLLFENTASKYTIEVTSEIGWTAHTLDSWISVEPSEGKAGKSKVEISVTPNGDISERSGSVYFYPENSNASSLAARVNVVQRGIYLEVNTILRFSASKETKTMKVESNTDWQIQSAPAWLSFSASKGSGTASIEVTAEENPSTSLRSGTIMLGRTGLSITTYVNVTQSGKSFSTDSSVLEFSDKAGSLDLSIKSDALWTSSLSDNWFSANPLTATGDATVKVSVTENETSLERFGTITYAFIDRSSTVEVHQLSKYLNVNSPTFDFPSTGGNHTIEILTNDTWTASVDNDVDWLAISAASGSGNAKLTLTAEDNPSVNVRSTTVTMETKSGINYIIYVSQKARSLTVSAKQLVFMAKGGDSEAVTVTCDGTYSITSTASWLTVVEGNNSFYVRCDENTSKSSRNAAILLELTDLVEGTYQLSLPVTQGGQGATFVIDGFSEDVNWGSSSNDTFRITVVSYTQDKNWNNTNNSTVSVNITGYTTDNDLNRDNPSNGNITLTPYGDDQNWNR